QCLMSIARHPVISKTQYSAYLPAAWSTLYQLTLLPADVLVDYLHDSTVTAELKQQKACDLVALHRIPKFEPGEEIKKLPAAANPKGARGPRGIQRRFVDITGNDATPDQMWGAQLLHRLGHAIHLAQPNWHDCWPLWRTFKVTPELIEQAKTLKAAAT